MSRPLLVVSGSVICRPAGIARAVGDEGQGHIFTSIALSASVYAASCQADGLTYVKYGDVLDPGLFNTVSDWTLFRII